MRLLHILVVALVAPALAGCIGSAPGPDLLAAPAVPTVGLVGVAHLADGLPLDAARAAALPGILGGSYHIGAESGEPTLGVAKDGQVFMSTMHFDQVTGLPVSGVRTSTDKGQTWSDVMPQLAPGVTSPPFSFDPYVYVDPATDRVFVDDLGPLDCSWLSWSDDHGKSWSTNPVACGTPLINDHQSLVAAKPRVKTTSGYANVLYYCVNRIVSADCATSLDGGLTFTPLVGVYSGVDDIDLSGCGGLTGHVKAAPDGRAFLPKGHCGVPEVAISDDDGESWTIYVISPEERFRSQGHEVSVAIDDAGHAYALWINTTGMPVLSVSRDGGYTWDEPFVVAAPGVTATDLPAIAAGASGQVALAYVGTTFHDGYENKTSEQGGGPFSGGASQDEHRWANATWNAYVGVLTDALAPQPILVTATANDPADPVARGVCGRTRCFDGNSSSGMFDFIDLVVDSSGRPWASFVDMCNAECAKDASQDKSAAEGFVATLRTGPSLRGAGTLPLLAAQAEGSAPAAPSEARACVRCLPLPAGPVPFPRVAGRAGAG